MIPNYSTKRLHLSLPLLIAVVMILNACGLVPPPTPKEIIVDPLRFTGVVDGYKAADSLKRAFPNSLLFVGSSSIHGWKTLADDFPELSVINRGMGGSHMSDLIYFMDDIVFPYRPNAIVVYEGDNDIAAGKTPEVVLNDYKTFVTKVFAKWPELPIFFIAIKPSIARIDHLENMRDANTLIKTYIDQNTTLFYVDIFNPMLGADGTPRTELFSDDGLHMNAEGYALWTKEIKKELGL